MHSENNKLLSITRFYRFERLSRFRSQCQQTSYCETDEEIFRLECG